MMGSKDKAKKAEANLESDHLDNSALEKVTGGNDPYLASAPGHVGTIHRYSDGSLYRVYCIACQKEFFSWEAWQKAHPGMPIPD